MNIDARLENAADLQARHTEFIGQGDFIHGEYRHVYGCLTWQQSTRTKEELAMHSLE